MSIIHFILTIQQMGGSHFPDTSKFTVLVFEGLITFLNSDPGVVQTNHFEQHSFWLVCLDPGLDWLCRIRSMGIEYGKIKNKTEAVTYHKKAKRNEAKIQIPNNKYGQWFLIFIFLFIFFTFVSFNRYVADTLFPLFASLCPQYSLL